MLPTDITGTYTYRSFLNEPNLVGDFNKLQFAEAELTLISTLEGKISGLLSWPVADDDSVREVMTVEGELVSREPSLIRLRGTGAKGSSIEAFEYVYEVTLAKHWPESTHPRNCLVGSVMRSKDHGGAKAGMTASVIAVQREFKEPRDIDGVTLLPSVIEMLASKWHRLWHATWHTVRGQWQSFKSEETRSEITKLGWGVVRPPRRKREDGGSLILDNGAGEDFLFMHRLMIKMVRDEYLRHGLTPPSAWKKLPAPDVAQVVYTPVKDANGVITFQRDASVSGNMVPSTGDWVKTPDYFNSVMRQWEANYSSPSILSGMSLGALGNLLEFTIHNAMHNRWMSPARDPDTGEIITDPETGDPAERPTFDFSDKWSSSKYDYLGEFYSSHVNPIFWRLHGWVDDRVEEWFKAQQTSRPGQIRRRELHGANWFEVASPWVEVDEPFVGVSQGDHDHGNMHGDSGHHHSGVDHQAMEIEVMLKVMAAIENDDKPSTIMSLDDLKSGRAHRARISMRFEEPGQI